MFTPSIENMTPGKIMRKEPFKRLLPAADLSALGVTLDRTQKNIEGSTSYEYPTYADFMREQSPTGHNIMSEVYYPDIVGYDEEKKRWFTRKVSRVTTNLPADFTSQRTSMLTGDQVDLKLVSGGDSEKMQELLSEFMEGWAIKDMENAVYELIFNCFRCVDCAILSYMDNSVYGWKALCYPYGDILYPHYNSFGRICLFGRGYKAWDGEKEIEFLDVWDDTNYIRYRSATTDEKGTPGWVVDQSATPHGFQRCPVSYHRRDDTVAGPAMKILDAFDLAMSQLCENNKQYALRIFYALGADVDIEASIDGRPMQVTSTDVNSKVGFLEPAESSGSFEVQMKQLIRAAYQAAHCSEPVELKSGADISSLAIQMMSKESYHQALLDAKEFQHAINDIIENFKVGYGNELGKSSNYENAKIKGVLHPYIMRSEVEEVNNLSVLLGSGAIPVEAAAYEAAKLGYGTPRNYQQIQQEAHDELVMESEAQAATQQQNKETNPVTASRNANA